MWFYSADESSSVYAFIEKALQLSGHIIKEYRTRGTPNFIVAVREKERELHMANHTEFMWILRLCNLMYRIYDKLLTAPLKLQVTY